jgi:polyphosphate kinase
MSHGGFRIPTVMHMGGASEAVAVAERRLDNRETSWVDFDARVLGLAADGRLPLLDRVRLCGIVSSNLDEFFAVRVARLVAERQEEPGLRAPDGSTSVDALAAIRGRVLRLHADQARLWLGTLGPQLRDGVVDVDGVERWSVAERRAARGRFRRDVLPELEPVEVRPGQPIPAPAAFGLGVLAESAGAEHDDARLTYLALPDSLPRFIGLGGRPRRVVRLEDLVVRCLADILGVAPKGHAVFRVTRDAIVPADLDPSRPRAALDLEATRRWVNPVVRLETESGAPAGLVDRLVGSFRIRGDQVYESAAPLGLGALRELAGPENTPARGGERAPAPTRPGRRRPGTTLPRIGRADVLVHHPYESYEASVGAFMAAAADPDVVRLSATLYRTERPSTTLATLMETAAGGRDARCVIELRARYDESRNIQWSGALRRAGVAVYHGPAGLKVHAKLAMIERREPAGLRRYVHIGTGNYHASNASTYEDLSLFTADRDIASDVAQVFDILTGSHEQPAFRKLIVGPWFLRARLMAEIARTIDAAHAGLDARIRLKVNALADPGIVNALYTASAAGVHVDVVTRGICALRPGVPGLSDLITVRSVLGRYLEHSRILTFEAGGRKVVLIGSADLLTRNLDRRVEVLVPVEDVRLQARIDGILDALLADTRHTWQLGANGTWSRVGPAAGEPASSAQASLAVLPAMA